MTWNPRDATQEWVGAGPEALRQRVVRPGGVPRPEGGGGRPEALPTLEAAFILGPGREEGEAWLEAALASEGMPPPGVWERWRALMFRGYPDLGAGPGGAPWAG